MKKIVVNVDKSYNNEKLQKKSISKNFINNANNRFIIGRNKSKNEMAKNKEKFDNINSIYKKI